MAEDIVKAETSMARPSFLNKNDVRGTENITKEDIRMPRLGLGQGLSPQVLDGNPARIPGLQVGMFFNNLTGEILQPPKGPINFTVIRAEVPRFIEFIPRDQGGGVKDLNVPPHDPRTQFTKDPVTGKSVSPVATKFYDFIVMLLPVNLEDPMSSLLALSLKSTGIKTAMTLNGLIKLRNAPSFAGKYVLTSGTQTNSKGTFATYQVNNAGWVSEEEYKLAELAWQSLEGKNVHIDRDDTPEDDGSPVKDGTATEFDASKM